MVPELLILNDFSEQPDIILPAMMKIFSVLTGNQHLPGFLRNNRTAAIRIAVPSLFFIFALYNQQFPTIFSGTRSSSSFIRIPVSRMMRNNASASLSPCARTHSSARMILSSRSASVIFFLLFYA